MKSILTILFLLSFLYGFNQTYPVVPRSNSSITVQDAREFPKLNLFVPQYADTTTANLAVNAGLDNAGALIYTTTDGKYWVSIGLPGDTRRLYWQNVGTGGSSLTAGSGIDITANVISNIGRFGKTGEDQRSTNGRSFSFANSIWKVDSLGTGSRFLQKTSASSQFIFDITSTNATDSSWFSLTKNALSSVRTAEIGVRNGASKRRARFFASLAGGTTPRLTMQSVDDSHGTSNDVNITLDSSLISIYNQAATTNGRFIPSSQISVLADSVTLYSGSQGNASNAYAKVGFNDIYLSSDSVIRTSSRSLDQYATDSLDWRSRNLHTALRIYPDSMSFWQKTGDYYVWGMNRLSDSTGNDVMVKNRTTNEWSTIPANLLSGATPTWQQTLTAGSTLTGTNTIDGGGFNLFFQNTGEFQSTSQINSLVGDGGGANKSFAIVYADSISLKPALGTLNIDSLRSGDTGDDVMTWSVNGKVGHKSVSAIGVYPYVDSSAAINILSLGAVGDGTTDNISVLRTARNMAATYGISIFIPNGTFYCSDSVTFNHMKVFGAGEAAIIKVTSTTVTAFNIQDSCEITGIKFIGTGRAAALPVGVFTLQDGVRIFGGGNSVHDNWMVSMNGSGVNIWKGGCCGYMNNVYDNRINTCTIAIFAMTNSEYLNAHGNMGELNLVGIYDRSSSNNKFIGNTFNYSVLDNFRLLGNGDHGQAIGNTFNHGNVHNVLIESCTLNYDFADNIVYTGDVAFGTVDTVHNFHWHGGTLSGATITGSKFVNTVMDNVIFGSTANTQSTTGLRYVNEINDHGVNPFWLSSDTAISVPRGGTGITTWTIGDIPTGNGTSNMVALPDVATGSVLTSGGVGTIPAYSASPTLTTSLTVPLINGSGGTLKLIGGTGVTDLMTYQSTTGNATATAIAHKWLGGNNGATTLMQLDNKGQLGLGTAPADGFKFFMVTGGATGATSAVLWRNSSSEQLYFQDNSGLWKMGNASQPTAFGGIFNKVSVGGQTYVVPTSLLYINPSTAAATTGQLKFAEGVVQTTGENGVMNFDTTGSNRQLKFDIGTTHYTIPHTLSASATLDFPSTGAGAIADLTISLTGAALNDPVLLGVPNGSVTATATFTAWVSTAGTITVRFSPKATEDPASGTFTVAVVKY